MRALVLAVVVLAACGPGPGQEDPRARFVGEFSGTGTTTVTYSDGFEDTSSGTTTLAFSAPESDELLHLEGACGLTATVSGNSYTLVPKVCPPSTFTYSGGTCTETLTVSGGGGTLSGDSLSANYQGTGALEDCTDGTSDSYGFSSVVTAQRAAQ